jgi:hypothetical protein
MQIGEECIMQFESGVLVMLFCLLVGPNLPAQQIEDLNFMFDHVPY